MFVRSKTLLVSGSISDLREYAGELTIAMHRITLDMLPNLERYDPRVATIIQLMNFPINCGYRLEDRLNDGHAGNVDLLATVARSLFECWVTFEYLKQDDFRHLEERVSEMVRRDEMELIEASLAAGNASRASIPKATKQRFDSLKAAKLPPAKKVKKLAELATVADE